MDAEESQEETAVQGFRSRSPFFHVAFGAGASILFHPLTHTKILIQLGYEPLPPEAKRTIFGRRVLAYPSIIKYMKYIKEKDGFLALYRGLGARLVGGATASLLANHVVAYLKEQHPVLDNEIDEDEEAREQAAWRRLTQETVHEMIGRCAAIVATQPMQVIMIRSMAQIIGGEECYCGLFGSISEIYQKDGILGFFAGLVPRLVGEALTIWLVNIVTHTVNHYLIDKTQAPQNVKTYTSSVCTLMVSQLTYPLNLVSNIMAVSDSGLAAGRPPYMPIYNNWVDCLSKLFKQGQMNRGASTIWRYYKGPVIIRYDGTPMPAKLTDAFRK